MGAGERPLVAAVAAQAELHNRLQRAMIGVARGADAGGKELRRIHREAELVCDARQEEIRKLVASDDPWSDDELRGLVRALASFGSWSFGGLDHVPVESIAKLIRRVVGQEPSSRLRRELLALGRLRLEQRGPAEARRAAMILADLGGARPDLAIGSGGGIDGDDDWGEAVIAALGERGGMPAGWADCSSTPERRRLRSPRSGGSQRPASSSPRSAKTAFTTSRGRSSARSTRPARARCAADPDRALAGLSRVPKAVPTERNALVLRGIVWTCAIPSGQAYADLVARAARACSKKIPEVGSRSPKVLNACLSGAR